MSRIAIINKEKCHPEECGNLCLKKCPINKKGDECIIIGDHGKAQISEELCIGCGICPKVCPFGAIDIINLPEEMESTPIHRYGENAFALYNLPTPTFGKVVGLLGRNGIGKSTAMKILAGVLSPNFENYEQQLGFEELARRFKGTEAQDYFEKLSKGEIRLSFKPQQIEMIPQTFDGKVRELLKKVDEKGEFNKISETLELEEILDRDIKNVSGGELQRIAIAASVLKKADVYFFDEPTSYMDIKQRLKIGKFLRSLADENTAVMVIEHDLIILDYLTDYIHLLYGREGAYGVVSGLKSTKKGINAYLHGYLREENIRFRDHEILFSTNPEEEEVSSQRLISWPEFDKKLGEFELDVKKGTIYRSDIVGVLGENGIGKTSFVKELVAASKEESGVKLDVNENIGELKVAYKPQYIEPEETIVRLYLKKALKYKIELLKPLNLEGLLDQPVKSLSGGELQRVTIAKTLAEDANIYLLDEPSAYLDVEQRLRLSKVIRNMMEIKRGSALVVDHDLLFIDYISKRLLVFEGKPAVHGNVTGPFSMVEGMFNFLKDLLITFRRDEVTKRPRVNKPDSQKDKEQKASGKLYYT
ncbi:MAG: ribosome biogenesis/translation initiation ATPase RLI [Candidatus Woesearchaeota archaeon]